jgi:hypothetical protein
MRNPPEEDAVPPEIKRFPFTPILGWSATRYEAFSICKRRYFYQYYAKYDRETPVRVISRYRELVSVPLEIGGIVHEVIAALLRRLATRPEDIDRERFLAFATGAARESLRAKRFEEVVYRQVGQIALDDMLPKIHQSLENLLASARYEWLAGEGRQKAGAWVIEPPGFGETRLGDLKVYCKVDFLFPFDEAIHIFDWKTGKQDADKHRKQLIGYATWASYHFETDPAHVRPTIAYLHPDYLEVQETFDADDLATYAVRVRAETEEMYEYCREVVQNIPLDKDEFARVDDERICGYCPYRGLCFPDRYPADV